MTTSGTQMKLDRAALRNVRGNQGDADGPQRDENVARQSVQRKSVQNNNVQSNGAARQKGQAPHAHQEQEDVGPANVPPTPVDPDFGTSEGPPENQASPETQAAQELAASDAEEFLQHMYHWDYLPGTGMKSSPQQPRKLQPNKSRTPLSDEEKDRVAVLMSHGYSLRQAAACIRRTHVTLSRHLKKDREFADKVERFRRHAESDAIDEIVKASRKSWRAAAWLLQYLERRERAQDKRTAESGEAIAG